MNRVRIVAAYATFDTSYQIIAWYIRMRSEWTVNETEMAGLIEERFGGNTRAKKGGSGNGWRGW